MARPIDFKRRMAFLGQRLRESGGDIIEETNREFRALAEKTMRRARELTPRQPDRPDAEPSPTPLKDGWRIVEEGNVRSADYAVAVVNVHDRPLTSKSGKMYRKANGQFFTLLDALDVGTAPHTIKTDKAFYFWWEGAPEGPRYFVGETGKTVIKHLGIERPLGVLRIPRMEAAREARNIRRRAQRRAARAAQAGGSR